ncbi:MAG: nucleotide sugar dehydrogenase [Defluviitaleaceae bacterium]|nr:nucleotide sugar dehydrogenase [Defluviitaleaceae bacterium]
MLNIIGLGYIGLPTALIMASNDIPVIGVDKNPSVVESLNRGEVTFEEDGLPALFKKAVQANIVFRTTPTPSDMYIIAVPTPFNKSTKRINPSYVITAIREVLAVCNDNAVIVIESTVAPGTIDKFIRPVVTGANVRIAHAPERIIPGDMVRELVNNARIIGADDEETAQEVKKLYTAFCKAEIVTTDIRSAEMSKVVENTFRDINIAFANELAKICRAGNMDVYEIIRIANMHPRVNILRPGPGVGGHCISVDPWFLVGDFPQLSLLIHEARKINDSMPVFVLERIQEIMKDENIIDISRIGFYGLTYKEDVDDTRESPTLQLFDIITKSLGQTPKCYDPMVKEMMFDAQYNDFGAFIRDIDFIVIMVGHSHLKDNMEKLNDKTVFDTRYCITPSDADYPVGTKHYYL